MEHVEQIPYYRLSLYRCETQLGSPFIQCMHKNAIKSYLCETNYQINRNNLYLEGL